jgi:GNAT superfamily N-acetyltransferase
MPESQAFWLMTTGLQVVDCFGRAPRARARFDEGGWLALTGEAAADLNMGCVLDGPAAAALLDTYVAEIDGLPTILLLENPSPELLGRAAQAGATHVGEVPTMVWQGTVVDRGDSPPDLDLDVRPASTDLEVDAAIALVSEAFSLELDMCRRVLGPMRDSPIATIWLGAKGGEFVGAGLTLATGEIVGVYCMATPERRQRQGIGRAVLSGLMTHHLAQGGGTARFLLGATEAGWHLYEQMHYEVVATPAALVFGSSIQFH